MNSNGMYDVPRRLTMAFWLLGVPNAPCAAQTPQTSGAAPAPVSFERRVLTDINKRIADRRSGNAKQ